MELITMPTVGCPEELGSRPAARLVVGPPEDLIPSLAVSRKQQAHYQAVLARLELLRRRGDLVVPPAQLHFLMAEGLRLAEATLEGANHA
jgi:hypothetical protein